MHVLAVAESHPEGEVLQVVGDDHLEEIARHQRLEDQRPVDVPEVLRRDLAEKGVRLGDRTGQQLGEEADIEQAALQML